jgi:hypothetical protein
VANGKHLIAMTPLQIMRFDLDSPLEAYLRDRMYIGDTIRSPSVTGCHDLSDDTLVAASSGDFVARVRKHAVEVYWSNAPGAFSPRIDADSFGGQAIAFLPDDTFLIAGGGMIDRHGFGEKAPRQTYDFTSLKVRPNWLAVAPDGLTAVAGDTKAAVMWDLE